MPNQTPPETRAADPGDDRAIPHLQLPPHQPAASSDRRGRFAFGGALCVGPTRTDAALLTAGVGGTKIRTRRLCFIRGGDAAVSAEVRESIRNRTRARREPAGRQ